MKKKREATEKSTEVEQNRKQITVEQEEAEEALEKALPDLENARAALDTLEKKDITEIRAFANPPEPVQIICESVAILKGFRDISWRTAKTMMSDLNFLKSLQEMNCDLITVKQVTSCRAHMKVCFFSRISFYNLSLLSIKTENGKNGRDETHFKGWLRTVEVRASSFEILRHLP